MNICNTFSELIQQDCYTPIKKKKMYNLVSNIN